MKSKNLIVTTLFAFALLFTLFPTQVSARTTTKSFYDKAHGKCNYIKLYSDGSYSQNKVYTVYFSSSYTHWPMGITEDREWSYETPSYAYANGKFTIYSSLVTQWASISFKSNTYTMKHKY